MKRKIGSALKALLISILPVLAPSLAFAAAENRPNILFIFSDDHAYQAISAYGDPRHLIETPNIDRIGREGMRFERCLVPNSLCGPSRATVITGTYNHINGFVNNTNCVFDSSQTTFPQLMQAAGYQTAMIGKWHLVSDPTGFDFWQILLEQGVYYNPPMQKMSKRIKTEGYVTDIITDAALDWLKTRDKAKPFVLMCQNKAPHRDWEPALRDLDWDHGRKYDEPPTLFDDYSGRGVAEHEQRMTIAKEMNGHDLKLVPPGDLTPEQRTTWDAYYDPRNAAIQAENLSGHALTSWKYQRFLHEYLGCVKGIDDTVGRLLKYLDDEGLTENTIVIYSSDQGFYLGEHGWFDKRWIFEESLRTPLLIRWPGKIKPGSVNDDMVSNLDFAETFLDVAGVPIPKRMQGRSLVPVLKGNTPSDWRKNFYYQYYEYPAYCNVSPHYGLVTDNYKLVHFFGADADYWELFDLKKDPNELKSVFDDPAYADARKQLEAELQKQRTALKAPEEVPKAWFGNPTLSGKPAGGPGSSVVLSFHQ